MVMVMVALFRNSNGGVSLIVVLVKVEMIFMMSVLMGNEGGLIMVIVS